MIKCFAISLLISNFVELLCVTIFGLLYNFKKLRFSQISRARRTLCVLTCLFFAVVSASAKAVCSYCNEPDSLLLDSAEVVSFNKDTVIQVPDTAAATPDSIAADSVIKAPVKSAIKPSKKYLEAEVRYEAQDSIVFFSDGTGYLYNNSKVKYMQRTPIELNAKYVRFQMDSSIVYAVGGVDSVGNPEGEPVFKEGNDEYKSKYMSYNFETKRGYVRGVVTQQDESYIVSEETKMMEDNTVYMKGGRLTTCDHHDHPHFYMQLTKAKMEPNSFLAAGPAYFVLGDVPLPIAIPFGFFPFTEKYTSGIIMPTFGEELDRGLFLKNGGYYWAINDYIDLEILGDIYTKGTWAVQLNSKYALRYKFSGNISLSYREDVRGEKNMPDYSKYKNFKVAWRHQQDPKSSQFSSFSASVDFTTSGYNTSNINNYYNPVEQSKNITSSSVNYTQRFPNSKWSISLNAQLTQRTQDSTISMTLPSFSVNLSQTYPFKRKNPVGKEKWYEKIYLSYSMMFNNQVTCKESEFFHTNFLRDWKNGVKHTLNIGAAYTLFKYLNFNVGVNGNWKWYFSRIDRDWDTRAQQEVMDTTYGFYNVYDFAVNASLSTKLYGFYTPIRKLFGDKVDRIRHLMTPKISFSYHPDFSNEAFGMYTTYERLLVDNASRNDVRTEKIKYSPFSHGLFGVPGQGTVSKLQFSIDNNVEMKIQDKKDTTGLTYKKVSLIDLFSIGWGYNFAADSLRWDDLTARLRLKLTKQLTLNLSTSFDPYRWMYNDYGAIVHSNQLHWDYHEPMHFTGFGTSFSYTFNNSTFKSKKSGTKEEEHAEEEQEVEIDPATGLPKDPNVEIDPATGRPKHQFTKDEKKKKMDSDAYGYDKLDIPWSLTVSYTFNYREYRQKDYYDPERHVYRLRYTHSMSINGNIQPTPKWNISMNAYIDLTAKRVTSLTMTVDRDLHCWRLSASISPVGMYKSFVVTIGIAANMLRDVKYEKRSDASSNVNWIDTKK